MDSREKLLSYLRTRQIIDEKISDITTQYLIEYRNKPLIYISDHAIVRYLERVKGVSFSSIDDTKKIYKYLRDNNMKGSELRREVLSRGEMEEIVKNKISYYHKGEYRYIIKNLALITIIKA